MNCITLTGRAGRDPEARYFGSGTMVANLTMAVNRMSRDEDPDWFNLEIWGKQAQVAVDYVRRGSLIGIIGSVRNEKWTDRNSGQERTKMVIRVDRLELMGGKKDSQQEDYASAPAAAPAAPGAPTQQAWAPNPAAGTLASQRPPQQPATPDHDGIPF
jgi:single-strand DNA-binding protein